MCRRQACLPVTYSSSVLQEERCPICALAPHAHPPCTACTTLRCAHSSPTRPHPAAARCALLRTPPQDRDGRTALMLAAMNGHARAVGAILSRSHASLNMKDTKDGMTALMLAAARGHDKVRAHAAQGCLTSLCLHCPWPPDLAVLARPRAA